MIFLLVLLLIAIVVWVLGSLPWLITNYFLCVPEPMIGCARPVDFTEIAKTIVVGNVALVVLAGVAIAYLNRLHRRHRRRQQLVAQQQQLESSD
ncbi:MAG: hypothetical protein VKJ64_11455 [Leptolyngbyaceae bacterium]|nr:hypothetical protein [Leptolyngbyaceae bacterium]